MSSEASNSAVAEEEPLQIAEWAELPRDILFIIVRYVDMKVDLPRVRGVCRSWRTALNLDELPPRDPHTVEVPSLQGIEVDGYQSYNLTSGTPLFLLESRFYFISPVISSESAGTSNRNCGGWIARMCEIGTGTETGINNRWHLLNPLRKKRAYYHKNMDYFYTVPPITGTINMLDFRVLELARSYSLGSEKDNYNSIDLSKKVVGGWDYTSSYRFAALMQPDFNGRVSDVCKNLLLWRLGDQQWLKVVGKNVLWILDIAFMKGKFYILEHLSDGRRVRVLNPRNPSVLLESTISVPDILLPGPKVSPFWNTFNLLPSKSKGCLFLVSRGFLNDGKIGGRLRFGSNTMYVLLMKTNERKWEQMENLGDEIFFIGLDVAFALPSSSQNLPQWKQNSICSFCSVDLVFCFFEVYSRRTEMPEGAECLQLVAYQSYNKYLSLFSLEVKEHGDVLFIKMPKEEQELYLGLFFPPPAWVKWRCPILDVEVRLDGLRFREKE